MTKYAFVKNKFVPIEEAVIPIQDRGFRFGDGIFETIRIKNASLQDFDLHLARLRKGLQTIYIDFNCHKLPEIAQQLIKKNKQQQGYLRIAISRGVGSRGYLPLDNIEASCVMETEDLRQIAMQNIKLGISSYQKISTMALPVNYKLMQGLNSTLSIMEARKNGYFDAILLNSQGNITETGAANFFAIKNGEIFTTKTEDGILCGVIREKIIKKFKVNIKSITLKELSELDLIFITNIAYPVLKVDEIHHNSKIIWKNHCNVGSQTTYEEIIHFIN